MLTMLMSLGRSSPWISVAAGGIEWGREVPNHSNLCLAQGYTTYLQQNGGKKSHLSASLPQTDYTIASI